MNGANGAFLEWNGRLRSVAEWMYERRAMRGADADAWTNELEWSVEGRNTEWKWMSGSICKEAHANNQYIYPLTAPWLGGGVNRGYSLWGKLVAEKGNRPLENVGKVRYGSEWDDQNGWILLLWLLIGHRFHRLKNTDLRRLQLVGKPTALLL